ncbi:hypothetical protein [uncultured Paraglaciecola sp.]|uniref:hypothetical protein n=1 Tax=uncultured Paraglaciecola sp. TaxID=1765024 RepID=UPI00345AB2D3
MGGITGSQTLTLTIRGLATGQLATSNSTSPWEQRSISCFFQWPTLGFSCFGDYLPVV